ncbi:ABC transporter ATP-binding protein [Rubripirellula tenax]|nr:ABC transporter ATP-binding protein [Rubripirellula tenax]
MKPLTADQSYLIDATGNADPRSRGASPSPAKPALVIDGLRKSFGKLEAIRGVSFQLKFGERLALLGPNGAGKTTLIRCLSGRTKPDAGSIELLGRPIHQPGVRESLGLVPQEIAVYPDLTTRENLRAFAKFHGLRRGVLMDRVDWALAWTGLVDRADDLVGGFSGGMKRRVNLACGVMHSPKVLLLDEPTVGVDPQSREKIFTMLDQLNESGTSILLTTHHLDEAEQRSDRIVIVDQGKVVADGTIEELVKQSIGTSRMVRIKIDRPLQRPLVVLQGDPEGMVSNSGLSGSLGHAGDAMVSTRIDDVAVQLPRLLDAVKKNGYDVVDLEVQSPSLHHVFLHMTGHKLRD